MGKGSQYRPVNREKYSREHDRIFGGRAICSNCGYLKQKDGVCTKCFTPINYEEKEQTDIEDEL